jgi:hypothetical protein
MLPRRQTEPIATIQNGEKEKHHERKRPSRRHTTKAICDDEVKEVKEDALVRSGSVKTTGEVREVQEDPVHPRSINTLDKAGAAAATIDSGARQLAMAHDAALDLAPALFSDPSVVAIQTLLARVQSFIDEIQCLSAGLTTLITELQKTPETFAAVGLSLAEIAQMLTHIAPAATIVLKSTFPTIFALISSPHFAVVAGVAGAATVVVLGGYKIVKNIMAGADDNLRLAYGELPDEDLLEEANLGGEVLGEVVEDQARMLEQAKKEEEKEKVEELPPVGIAARSSPSKREKKKSLMPPEDPVEAQFKPERRLFGGRGKEKEEKREKVVREKVVREQKKVAKPEKDDKKMVKHEKKPEKEKEERRKEKEKDRRDKTEEKLQEERRKEKERRKSAKQNSSTSSGVSSNRSESSLDHRVKEKSKSSSSKPSSSSASGEKEKEKDKKKFSMKAMFSGKSV